MIIVSGIIELDPSDHDRFVDLVGPLVSATTAEPGCISYEFFVASGDPGRFRVFEEWQDDDALAAHFGQPHMAAFMEGLGNLSVRSSSISKYVVSDTSALM